METSSDGVAGAGFGQRRHYPDCPPSRPNDWAGKCARPIQTFRPTNLPDGSADEGGRGQERTPGDEQDISRPIAEPAQEEDHDENFAGEDALSRLRQAATVRAHAMNEGDHHSNHDDILPAF